jgi:hypothetical protein
MPLQLRASLDHLRSMVIAGTQLTQTSAESLNVEDLYRAAWVQAVAAVDSWIRPELRNRTRPPDNPPLPGSYDRPTSPPDNESDYPMRFQPIEGTARTRRLDLWADVADVLSKRQPVTAEALRARMDAINERRHLIVHHSDHIPGRQIARTRITAQETIDTIDWLEMFATAAWTVFGNQSR